MFPPLLRFPNLATNYITSKEHVLRNSSSTSAIKMNNQPDQQPLELAVGDDEATADQQNTASDDRYTPVRTKPNHSPTPSIKKGKAEKLLKEHGSPPGMRVTAGGRVVPTDLAPLGSPRFSFDESKRSASQAFPIASSPSNIPFPHTNVFSTPCVPYHHSFHSKLVAENDVPAMPSVHDFDVSKESNYSHLGFDGYFPWLVSWQLPEPSTVSARFNSYPCNFNSQNQNQNYPPASMKTHDTELLNKQKGLEQLYARMEHDLKEFEKQEVLKQDTTTDSERQKMVQKKKEMIIELDKVRKTLKETKQHLETLDHIFDESAQSQPFTNFTQHICSHAANSTSLASQMSSRAVDGKIGTSSSQIHSGYVQEPLSIYCHEQDYSLINSMQTTFSRQGAPNSDQSFYPLKRYVNSLIVDRNESSLNLVRGDNRPVTRSSHALPIKDPKDVTGAILGKKTSLNPTSPNYEPTHLATVHKGADTHSRIRTSNSTNIMAAENDCRMPYVQGEEAANPSIYLHGERTAGRVSSLSSVATADFFPKDTAEHSSAKYDISQPIAGAASLFSRNLTNAWNTEALRKDQNRHHQPLFPRSVDTFGPIAPPVSPAEIRSQRSVTESSGFTSKDANHTHSERLISSRLPEDVLLGALTKYQSDKERDISPAQIDIEGRSTTFVEGFYAGLLHGPIPLVTDSDFDKGYCIGLLNSRKNALISARTNSSEESHQSSSLSLKSDILPVIEPQRSVNVGQGEYSSSGFCSAYGLQRNYGLVQEHPKKLPVALENGTKSASAISNKNKSYHNTPPKMPTWILEGNHSIDKATLKGKVNKISELPNAWSIIRKEPSGGFPTARAPPNIFLSENAVPFNEKEPSGQQTSSFASRIRTYPTYTPFCYNQPSKSRISIAPSKNQANGLLQQYDGAVGELKDLSSNNSNGSSPSTPARRLPYLKRDEPSKHTKEVQIGLSPKSAKEAPSSPARSCSSRKTSISPSKTKIGNLTTMIKNTIKSGEERPDELNGSSKHNLKDKSRRKENWRENWRKRFQEIKTKEKEEIEKYKRENPIE